METAMNRDQLLDGVRCGTCAWWRTTGHCEANGGVDLDTADGERCHLWLGAAGETALDVVAGNWPRPRLGGDGET